MIFLKLAYKSLLERKGSIGLTIMAISLSVMLLLGVEQVRHEIKENFNRTVSGIDLIVGTRTGQTNLLLYSVFRIGAPTNNISWEHYEHFNSLDSVKWTIPISLGDSHRGYRVIGTSSQYFEHFSYGNQQHLEFQAGKPFNTNFEVVLGADVAKTLGYQVGQSIILSHGIAKINIQQHSEHPFTISGILKPTGTPVDQTVHASLAGIEAIHHKPNRTMTMNPNNPPTFKPTSITAFMIGLESKLATFKVQREINQYTGEPLTAILPGVALSELWQMLGVFEKTLKAIGVLVLVTSTLGLSAMLLTTIHSRKNEIALLRAVGAPASFLFLLIQTEALLIALVSAAFGWILISGLLYFAQPFLLDLFSLNIQANTLRTENLLLVCGVVGMTVLTTTIPSIVIYKPD